NKYRPFGCYPTTKRRVKANAPDPCRQALYPEFPGTTLNASAEWCPLCGSDVVVESELRGRGSQTDLVDLVIALEGTPLLENTPCKHVALQQELVVPLQGAQAVFEGSRHGGDVLQLLGAQGVDVLVQRIAGIHFVL